MPSTAGHEYSAVERWASLGEPFPRRAYYWVNSQCHLLHFRPSRRNTQGRHLHQDWWSGYLSSDRKTDCNTWQNWGKCDGTKRNIIVTIQSPHEFLNTLPSPFQLFSRKVMTHTSCKSCPTPNEMAFLLTQVISKRKMPEQFLTEMRDTTAFHNKVIN